jgi:hypothetical protein
MPRKLEYKASDFSKRLKVLENQLYGKSVSKESGLSTTQSSNTTSDVTYLKQDLTKISILTAIAITVQIVLYYFVF